MNAMTLTQPQVTDEPSVSIVTSDVNALTKHDRCDRCRAQAYGRVTLASGFELLFCGHHLNAHMPKVLPLASKVEDYRSALTTGS